MTEDASPVAAPEYELRSFATVLGTSSDCSEPSLSLRPSTERLFASVRLPDPLLARFLRVEARAVVGVEGALGFAMAFAGGMDGLRPVVDSLLFEEFGCAGLAVCFTVRLSTSWGGGVECDEANC